jgi:branched-chain amino acid transport system permease protein
MYRGRRGEVGRVSVTLVVQQVANGIVTGSVEALFALGLTISWGVLKILNLAHAQIFTMAALTAVYVGNHTGLPLWAVTIAAILAGGLLAVAGDAVAFWPQRRRHLDTHAMELNSLITSFGVALILTGIAEKVTNSNIVRLPQRLYSVHLIHIGGVALTSVQIIVAAASVLLSLVVWWAIGHARAGTALRALAYRPEMTQMSGVNVGRLTRGAFFLCGALAGCAAVLLSMLLGAVDATFGTDILLQAIAIIVIAGSGRILGALVAGLLLGIVQDVGSLYWSANIGNLIPFVLIAVILLIRPAGLFGRPVASRA